MFYLVRFGRGFLVRACLGLVRAVAGRICAKRATRRRRTRNDDDKKQTKTQNPKKKKKKKKEADQKENPVVGGYFIVLITAGSIQRVLNRLFLWDQIEMIELII